MKAKRTIPSADEVRAQGQVELDFNSSLDPGDSSLPRPLGANGHRKRLNLIEQDKLEATRMAGGLVADDGTRAVWICSNCGRRAWYCHRAEPRLIRICVRCEKPPQLCRCPERNH
jgi:hypothetical protein